MTAGARITMNSTGRKKAIIGTVSWAGRAPAFFSARDMRSSRFSSDSTRRETETGVPYFSDCSSEVASDLVAGRPVRQLRF